MRPRYSISGNELVDLIHNSRHDVSIVSHDSVPVVMQISQEVRREANGWKKIVLGKSVAPSQASVQNHVL